MWQTVWAETGAGPVLVDRGPRKVSTCSCGVNSAGTAYTSPERGVCPPENLWCICVRSVRHAVKPAVIRRKAAQDRGDSCVCAQCKSGGKSSVCCASFGGTDLGTRGNLLTKNSSSLKCKF
jgi:hypothetical protein